MAQQRATIILSSDTRQAEEGINRVNSGLTESKTKALELSTAFNQMNLSIAGSSSTLGAMRNLLGTLGLGVGIQQLTQYADAWANLNARLKIVTNSYQEFQTAQKGVFDIAQQTRQSLKETGDLYYKVADSTRAMGISQQQVLQHTRAVSQAIVISGSSAESAKAALIQYGQAMASNRLGGDELRSIAEQAPRLFRLIRENLAMVGGGFGATQAQFKALAADGYISTEKMVEAVNRGSKSLEKEFSKLPLTIGQAWQLLENQMLKFVGSQGESTGMFTAVANGVKLLADNINHLVNVLGIGVASFGAFKAASVLTNFGNNVATRKDNLAALEAEKAAAIVASNKKISESILAAQIISDRQAERNAIKNDKIIASEIKKMNAEQLAIQNELKNESAREAILARTIAAQTTRDGLITQQMAGYQALAVAEEHHAAALLILNEATAESAMVSAMTARTAAELDYIAALELEEIALSNNSAMTLSATELARANAIATVFVTEAEMNYLASIEAVNLVERTAIANGILLNEGNLTLAASTLNLAEANTAASIARWNMNAANSAEIATDGLLTAAEIELSAATRTEMALLVSETTVVIPANIRAQRELSASLIERMVTQNRLNATAIAQVQADTLAASSMGARMASTQAANAVIFANVAATQAQTIAAREQAIANSFTTKTFEFMRGIIPFLTVEMNALTAAMLRNPTVVLATAVTALVATMYAYRDSLVTVGEKSATVSSIVEASWINIKEPIADVFEYLGKKWDSLGEKITGSDWFKFLKENSEKQAAETPTGLSKFANYNADDKARSVADKAYFENLKSFESPEDKQAAAEAWRVAMDKISNTGIMAQAEKLDSLDKLIAKIEADKNQNEKSFMSNSVSDMASKYGDKAGDINSIENHNKQIKKYQDERILGDKLFNRDLVEYQKQADSANNQELKDAAKSQIDTLNSDHEKLIKSLEALTIKENDAIAQLNKKSTAGDKNNPYESLAANYEKSGAKLDAVFEKNAAKYKVSVDLLKSIGLVESNLNENVKDSSAHAVGVMQVKPKAYGGGDYGFSEAQLRTTEGSIEAGTKAISMLIDKYPLAKLETIIALFHEGETKTALANMKAHGGNLDLTQLPSKEGRDYVGKVQQANKALTGNFSEIASGVKEQNDALKKSEDDLNKHFDEQNKIHEKVLALKSKYTKDSGDQFLTDEQAAWHWLKSQQLTYEQYLQVMKGIASAREAAFAKKIEPVTNYNATIDESQANLARKAITPQQHSINVATANAGLMNQVTDKQIPSSKVGEVIDAQSALKATEDIAKFKDEMEKATTAFDSFGNSGKMAFDGILGGISAVASAATSFSDEMSKLSNSQTKAAESYQKIMDDSKKSEAEKSEATKSFTKEKEAYDAKSFETEIAGARSLAGATANLFGQKTAAYKAFHAIEMGLAGAEMAMQVMKLTGIGLVTSAETASVAPTVAAHMVKGEAAAAEAVAEQATVPIVGFGLMAAMAAAMVAIGFMGAGGSHSSTGAAPTPIKTTGTVLGDNAAQSTSATDIVKTLNDISNKQFPELQQMVAATRSLGTSISNMIESVVKVGNIQFASAGTNSFTGLTKSTMVNFLATGIIGALFSSQTTRKVIDGGIQVDAQTAASVAQTNTLLGNTYTVIDTTTKRLFSTVSKITTVLTGLNDTISQNMARAFTSMGTVVSSYLQFMGQSTDAANQKVDSYVIQSANIQTFGKSQADINTEMKDYMSSVLDGWTQYVSNGFLESFQQLGESLGNTMSRVMLDATQVKHAFANMGLDMNLSATDLITFSESMINVSGSLDNLITLANNAADKLNTTAQKTAIDVTAVTSALTTNADALKNAGIDTTDVQQVVNDYSAGKIKTPTETASDTATLNTVISQLQAAVITQNKAMIFNSPTAIADANNAFHPTYSAAIPIGTNPNILPANMNSNWVAALNSIGNGDWTKATSSNLGAVPNSNADPLTALKNNLGGSNPIIVGMIKTALSIIAANDATSAAAIPKVIADKAGDGTLASYTAGSLAETAANTPLNTALNSVLGAVTPFADTIKAASDLSKNVLASQESILANTTTTNETLNRTREAQLQATVANGDNTPITSLATQTLDLFTKYNDKLVTYSDSLTDGKLKFLDLNGKVIKTGESMQVLSFITQDAAKSISNLTESSKYIKDFSTSIKDWATGLSITSLGNTKTQLDAAAQNFSSKISVINNDFMTADQKRTALSGITGNADQYIQAIKNFYGSSKQSADLIQGVIDQVSALPQQLDVQQLQLNALDAIKNSVDSVGLDVGAALQPALTALQAQYKIANVMDTGLLKNSFIAVLDTLGTGILNASASNDPYRQQAAAHISTTGISAASAIISDTTMSASDKQSALDTQNAATVAAGDFMAVYTTTNANLALAQQAVLDFNTLISTAVKNIGDKNFSAVFISALSGFTTAMANTQLSLNIMEAVAEGAKNAVSAWALVTKIDPSGEASTKMAAGVIAYSAYVSKIATDYTITDKAKAQAYLDFAASSELLYGKISGAVSGAAVDKKKLLADIYSADVTGILTTAVATYIKIGNKLTDYNVTSKDVKNGVTALIGSESTKDATGIGAMGLIQTLSGVLGLSAVTYAQKKPFIDKLLKGTNSFVDGYQGLIGTAGLTADIKTAKSSLIIGFNDYISGASGLLKTSNVTDINIGITSLNGALNDVIVAAAEQIRIATQVTESIAAKAASDKVAADQAAAAQQTTSPVAPVSSGVIPDNIVPINPVKTFAQKYGVGIDAFSVGIDAVDTDKLGSLLNKPPEMIAHAMAGRLTGDIQVYDMNMVSLGYTKDMPMFAKGGITNQPSIFGEAGAEAAVPLPDGRSIPVTLNRQASNDSNGDAAEEIRELRKELKEALEALNRSAQANIKVNQTGFVQLINENQEQNASLKSIKTTTQEAAYG
jgi:tape measure domain-containing protein